MTLTFDPYKMDGTDVTVAEDALMTNPTAPDDMERYWASLPRTRGVPHRRDVDPSALSGLLEDTFILERVAPGVARIRVAGRSVAALLGVEPRGLPLTAAFLPASRTELSRHLEAAFMTPAIIEIPLVAPRAVGQPHLQGKILFLPLRDDHGRVSRMLGVLVMSGRRGLGGRRFNIAPDAELRCDPIVGLRAVDPNDQAPQLVPSQPRHSLRTFGDDSKKAGDTPALRLVVSNP